ncbi:MAG: hypothetical protein J7474_01925 [Arthrobacter sp.]|nr:hypothetical protein [Arthrobacter sp.]
MRTHISAAAILIAATSALCITACSPTAPTGASSAPAQSPSPAPLSPTIQPGQTIWHLAATDGTAGSSVPDDDPDVQAAQKAVALHTRTVDERSAQNVASSVAQEETFYTRAFTSALGRNDYATKTKNLFTASQLETRSLAIAWYVSTLTPDRKTAHAEIDATFEFVHAGPGFLRTNQFALNKPYTQHRTLTLVKEGSRWLINDITKQPLTRKEGNGQ